jgi:hypothetical protein
MHARVFPVMKLQTIMHVLLMFMYTRVWLCSPRAHGGGLSHVPVMLIGSLHGVVHSITANHAR